MMSIGPRQFIQKMYDRSEIDKKVVEDIDVAHSIENGGGLLNYTHIKEIIDELLSPQYSVSSHDIFDARN